MPTPAELQRIFGAPQASAGEVAGLPMKGGISQEDQQRIFGGPAQAQAAKPQSLTDKAVSLAAATGDMILGIPGQAVNIGTDWGVRTLAKLQGESQATQDTAGNLAEQTVGPEWTAPLQTLAGKQLGTKPWDTSGVEHVMNSAADTASKYSGMSPDEVKLLVNTGMTLGGAKMGDVAVEAAMKPRVAAPATPTQMQDWRDNATTSEPPATPSTAADIINQATGVKPPLTAEDAIAQSKQRLKDIKAAVKAETPQEKAARTGGIMAAGEADWAGQRVQVVGDPTVGADGRVYTPVRGADGQINQAPATELKAAKTEPQVGLPAPTERVAMPTNEPATPAPADALYSGLAKAKAGQGATMSPEEKVSVDQTLQAGGKIVGLDGQPIGKGITQGGQIDPRLLTALGLGSAAVYAAMNPDDRNKLISLGLLGSTMIPELHYPTAVRMLMDSGVETTSIPMLKRNLGIGHAAASDVMEQLKTAGVVDEGNVLTGQHNVLGPPKQAVKVEHALGPMVDTMKPYTSTVLERLQEGKGAGLTEITRERVQQELNRADVSGAEREVFARVLGDKEKISAEDLVGGFAEEVAGWKLEPKETAEYDDYGLERINRTPQAFIDRASSQGMLRSNNYTGVEPTTTLWRLPEHMQMSDANHFSDSRLFGWTRSFKEEGITHVVENQSDLAQHAKGALEGEAYSNAVKRLSKNDQEIKDIQKDLDTWDTGGHEGWFDKGQAQRALQNVKLKNTELVTKLNASAVSDQLSPSIKHWPRRLIRETLVKHADEKVVRFATADTVAKVEGWPNRLIEAKAKLEAALKAQERKQGSLYNENVRTAKAEVTRAEQQPFDPNHQSIYNRYAGDITRYLKGLGGKEVTDAHGHTWIEVPTSSVVGLRGPRVKMLGAADPVLLAKVAAAAGVGAYLYANPDKLKDAAIIGAIGMTVAKGSGFKFLEEGKLLDLAREGGPKGEQAMAELYRKNEPMLRRSLHSFERSGVNVDDVVQEAFVSAMRAVQAGAFRGESKLSTYLHRIGFNKANNAIKAMKSRPDTTELTPEIANQVGHDQTPANIAQNEALGNKLSAAMDKVDPLYREAFELRELEGKSYEDIAAQQGVPINTVRSRIFRAKEQLQHAMRDYKDLQVNTPTAMGEGITKAAKGQEGNIDPKLVAGIAALGTGAALGAYLNPNEPIRAGMMGVGVAAMLMSVRPTEWMAAYKRAMQAGPRVSVSDFMDEMTGQKKVQLRMRKQIQDRIDSNVPDRARREAIYEWLSPEGKTRPVLTQTELKTAHEIKGIYEAAGKLGQEKDVLRGLLDEYATRLYAKPSKGLLEGKLVGNKTTQSTPFAKPRGFKTRAEAEAAGYVPVTTDITDVLGAYLDSLHSAILNKELVRTLKQATLKDGTSMVANMGKAPTGYVDPGLAEFKGSLVHPDIAADLKNVFGKTHTGAILNSLDALNATQKRLAVTMSLFHVQALEQAMLGATSVLKSPMLAVKTAGQAFAPNLFGENLALKMLREGGAGDMVDRGLKAGLQITLDKAGTSTEMENVTGGMYTGLDYMTHVLDNAIPGLGTQTAGRFAALNHAFDKAMWGRFHAALKIQTFAEKVNELNKNNADAVEVGKGEKASAEEIDKQAASFTNDLYGGLDWYKIASGVENRIGREFAMALTSPAGKLGMRLVLFAPDWTISTTRAFVKAFGTRGVLTGVAAVAGSQMDTRDAESKLVGALGGALAGYGAGRGLELKGAEGSGWRGALPTELGGKPMNIVDLHRQYVIRSAILYSAIVDALNYHYSGHHFWQNEGDKKLRLDLGDGRTATVAKHFTEPFHWLLDPKKTAMGKASFLVKETQSQLTDSEYWTPRGAPRMGGTPAGQDVSLPTRLNHIARQFSPISAQGFTQANPQSALASLAGIGIYGRTAAQERERKAELKKLHGTLEWKREHPRKRK